MEWKEFKQTSELRDNCLYLVRVEYDENLVDYVVAKRNRGKMIDVSNNIPCFPDYITHYILIPEAIPHDFDLIVK